MPVSLPIDRIISVWPRDFRGANIGALLHAASTTSLFEPTLDVLRRHNGSLLNLKCLFGPQHGFATTTQDNMIEWNGFSHPELGMPVYSLYGEHREPTAEMLDGLDGLLIDLFDIGSRYYTYIWTMYLCMKACAEKGIKVLVMDRPNPITGLMMEGPTLEKDYASFVGLHPLRIRHGKTIGELAKLFKSETFPDCDLEVLPMQGWRRGMWYDETGLPWITPSPNMPTLDTATVYPGMCLLEGTNISEARGTTRPFEMFGAPWIRGADFKSKLARLGLPGLVFREVSFEPGFQKYAGETCHGAQIHVTNRNTFQPYQTAVEIIKLVREDYPNEFQWKQPPYEYEYEKLPISVLLGGPVEEVFGE